MGEPPLPPPTFAYLYVHGGSSMENNVNTMTVARAWTQIAPSESKVLTMRPLLGNFIHNVSVSSCTNILRCFFFYFFVTVSG